MERPGVSIVIPFAGDRRAANEVVAAFRPLRIGPRDEIVVGDNSSGQVFAEIDLPSPWRAVPARGEGSPARARNAGGDAAASDWILFVDSDCVPDPGLLDAYFAEPIDDDCGIVAGAIVALAGQSSSAARYAATREHLDQRIGLDRSEWKWAHTANFLVRAELWRELGGFLEGVRVAEDVDFCWRAQRAGRRLAYNERAVVQHAHRDSFGALWRQAVTAGASEHWVHRRWPHARRPRHRTAAALGRAALAAPFFLVTLRPRRALFKIYDAALALAPHAALLRSNRPPNPARDSREVRIELWTGEFPEAAAAEEAAQLAAAGTQLRVVAERRPDSAPVRGGGVPVRYLEDDTPLERVRALGRLALRHPLRCLRARRRSPGQSPLRELAPAVLELERSGARVVDRSAGAMAGDVARVVAIARAPH